MLPWLPAAEAVNVDGVRVYTFTSGYPDQDTVLFRETGWHHPEVIEPYVRNGGGLVVSGSVVWSFGNDARLKNVLPVEKAVTRPGDTVSARETSTF